MLTDNIRLKDLPQSKPAANQEAKNKIQKALAWRWKKLVKPIPHHVIVYKQLNQKKPTKLER